MPTPVYTFTAGTIIQSAQVNTNFALLTQCVSKTGDTLTGPLVAQHITPSTPLTYSLGNASNGWLAVYAKGLSLFDSDNSNILTVFTPSNLTANRSLAIDTGDANRVLTIGADIDLSASPYIPGGTDVALADGGTGASLADPGGDRILFWDDSGNAVTWLSLGSGLSITGTTISASVAGGVTAGAALTDNKLVRGDGGGAGVQTSGVDLDDSNNLTGINVLTCSSLTALIHVAKSAGVVYQAGADGILTAVVDCTAGGGAIGTLKVLTDASNPPTTVLGGAFATDGDINMASVPVKKGDYYKVNATTGGGAPNYIIYFNGFGASA